MEPEIIMTAMGMFVSIIFFLVFVIIGAWIWTIVDCAKKEINKNDRTVRILTIVLLGVPGMLFYIFVRRLERVKNQNTELPINRKAIASLILGSIGFASAFAGIGYVLCIAGIVYGHKARREIQTGNTRGNDIARSGLIMAYLPFGVIAVIIAIGLPLALFFGNKT